MIVGVQLGSWTLLRDRASEFVSAVWKERMDVLAPKPIRGLAKLFVRGDGKVNNTYLLLKFVGLNNTCLDQLIACTI